MHYQLPAKESKESVSWWMSKENIKTFKQWGWVCLHAHLGLPVFSSSYLGMHTIPCGHTTHPGTIRPHLPTHKNEDMF